MRRQIGEKGERVDKITHGKQEESLSFLWKFLTIHAWLGTSRGDRGSKVTKATR